MIDLTIEVPRQLVSIRPGLDPGLVDKLRELLMELVQVVPDSPAAKAGLQEEDVIVRLDDLPLGNDGELSKSLIAHPPGETVTVVFFRGNEQRITQITLGKRPIG